MSSITENFLILQALVAYKDRLKELLGDQWETFWSTLVNHLEHLTTDSSQVDIQRAVDNILELSIASPAAELVREVMTKAALEAGNINASTRSSYPSNSTSNDIRETGITPEYGYIDLDVPSIIAVRNILIGLTPELTNDKDSVPETERHISAWVSERAGDSSEPLLLGETYTLNFKVGNREQSSLINGHESILLSSDIPDNGLETEWLITSSTIKLTSLSTATSVKFSESTDSQIWSARFFLHIPKNGDSLVSQLSVMPQTLEKGFVCVHIYSRQELYRRFTIELAVSEIGTDSTLSKTVTIKDHCVYSPLAHLNLRTTHEWTTPPGELVITIFEQWAHVRGDAGLVAVDDSTLWSASSAMVAGPIINARNSIEKFRSTWEKYLNNIDPSDLENRLKSFKPQYDWDNLFYELDSDHQQLWDQVSVSQELWDLAYDGYALYNSFFPEGYDLRKWIDALIPSQKLSFSWLPTSGAGWIAHVPWGLMYKSPTIPGDPIDPFLFFGLRYRLSYTAYRVAGAPKTLGSPDRACGANLLYWGNQTKDVTGIEARWQEQQISNWRNQLFAPLTSSVNPKVDLLKMLNAPAPSPVAVLYFFCQCSVGNGNEPVLRFGNTIQISDIIRRTELGGSLLSDRPIVFANACTTAGADPYIANELEKTFFSRGCRAYIGTESKVPIQLASRFAYTFFCFFYRKVDKEPMAAGEAICQSRLFLWTQFKNIGGLFYSYINQYELFMAEEAEILALRR